MRQKVLFNTSSERLRVPTMVYSTFLKLLTIFSQMPPGCGALSGLNLHLMPLCESSAAMLILFQFSIHSRSFFSAPIKLVPISHQIIAGVPGRETNRSLTITQEQLSVDGTTSTWTARVFRKVKRNPHLFSVVQRTVT